MKSFKVIISLIGVLFIIFVSIQTVFAQEEDSSGKSTFQKIMEIILRSDGSSELDPSVGIPAEYDRLGLPEPEMDKVAVLVDYLNNNSKANWAVTQLLAQEKNLSGRNVPVILYLTTAWLWFETEGPGPQYYGGVWPDPYLQNCNDSYGSPSLSFTCPASYYRPGDSGPRRSLLQVAGYQIQERAPDDYIEIFNICYDENQIPDVIARTYQNSNFASKTVWDYHQPEHNNFINQYLWGADFNRTIRMNEEIQPDSVLTNPSAQARSVLLGKDPCMVIGLNSKAVTQSFLTQLQNASDTNPLYGYIREAQKQKIANYMAALYAFDTGSYAQPTGTINITPSDTEEGTYGNRVTSIVHQNCRTEGIGVVTERNYFCLDNLEGVMNDTGIWTLKSSAITFEYVQCVGCAVAMAHARNRPYYGSGNAKEHAGQVVPGYTYFANNTSNWSKLVPGSLGISREGTYGHIWYVTEVYDGDNNGIPEAYKAYECNYGGSGYMRHDVIRIVNSSYLTGWQKPNSL